MTRSLCIAVGLTLAGFAGWQAVTSGTAESPSAQVELFATTARAADASSAVATGAAAKTITFDDIKFEMDDKETPFDRKMLTESIEKLDGQRIRVRGYMLPTYRQSGLTQFILMRDNMECCFGPGAWIFDSVVVDMLPGESTEYETRPVSVEGKFKIEELVDPDGIVRSVYHIDAQKVE